jgi:hypothetical protein
MSLLGTYLKPRPPKLSSITAVCATNQYGCLILRSGETRKDISLNGRRGDNGGLLRSKQRWKENSSFEDIFIRSLVLASSCGRCKDQELRKRKDYGSVARQRRQYSWGVGYQPSRQDNTDAGDKETRNKTGVGAAVDYSLGRHIPREEYRQLAETYDSPSDLWEQPIENPASVGMPEKLLHMPLAPRLVLTQRDGSYHLKMRHTREHFAA